MHHIRIFISTLLFAGIWMAAYPQTGDQSSIEVQGNILDATTKLPVDGVTVSIPGFSSVFSDSLGNFVIQVPHNQSTIFVGGLDYQSRQVPIKGQQDISIQLHEQGYKSQDELAQLYYENKPMAYTTQSVVSIGVSGDSWKRPSTSVENQIDNKVAGLRIMSRSGIAGIGSNMFMRGFSSMYSSNQPLIILDGLIYETSYYGSPIINGFRTNPLNSINTNDIENVTVVRDASSIYGSRASNGVIYIQTLSPDEMATRIDFSMYGGINYAPRQIPLLNSDEYRIYLAEIMQTSGIGADSIQSMPFMIDDPSYPEYYRYHNETNWQDEVYANSTSQNVNLKITGGDDVALYALSVGYQNHEGIIKNTNYSRYSFRFNSNINISPKLILKTNLGFTFNQNSLKEDGDSPNTNPLHNSLIKSPFLFPNVRSSSGATSPNLDDTDIFGIGNPTSMIQNLVASSDNYKILGSVDLEYSISDNLKVNNYLGINFDKTRDNLFVPYLGIAADTLSNGIAGNKVAHKVERYFNVYDDFRVSYTKILGWKHQLNGLVGARFGINKTQGDWGMDYNTPNDQIRSLGNGVSSLREVDGYFGDWNWVTFYAKVGYAYNNKYLLNLNLAMDGSSRFGVEADGVSMLGGQFGVFPSAAAAWLISSEPFMNSVQFISFLKLRVSYGITGNDNIGNYASRKYYISQNLLGSQGLVRGNLYNPALQWETNTKLNGGLDLTLLNDRLSFSVDIYQNRTDDMLNIIFASPVTGFDYYIDNSGSFSSKGMDFSLQGRLINGPFKWDVGIILSKYKTNLIEFPVDQRVTSILGANIISKIGAPINQFYGYKTLGVFASDEEAAASGLVALMPNTDLVPFSAGDVIFDDSNGDKIIDENDMQVIGDPNPDITGMFTSSISWKRITLDAGLSFSYGNDIYNHLRYQLESMQNANNQTESVLNRWRSQGQETEIPKAVWGDPIGNARFSDRWIEDGSYLRLSYVSLSYGIPIKSGFLNSIEIFISGHNLLTVTSYLGLDPDLSMSESVLSQGIDVGLTPQPRSVYAGIKIGL